MELKDKNITELKKIAQNIRNKIIKTVSKNGGHLAPNLGVVELTIVLHYVYNSPKDKFVWDVGHQTYTHKILTDREKEFKTIRLKGGLAPFSDPNESEHDQFISGHAGNSISVAQGLAMTNPNDDVIVVVGDASFGNGTSLEALNDIKGNLKNLTIVINDNEMSIGQNVGAISDLLNKVFTSYPYLKFRNDTRELFKSKNLTKSMIRPIEKIENSVRALSSPAAFFNMLGYEYIGPIDGHDLENMIKIFKNNKKEKSRIIHIKTQKGKGYKPALEDPENFHGVGSFNTRNGEILSNNKKIYSNVFGEKLVELMHQDKKILAFSAGMIKGTSLKKAKEIFPNRVFDTGMTEGHTVTLAGSLAKEGKKPYVAIYSTFLARSYAHLIHDVSILKLPVRLIIDRAGIVSDDGKTHQGVFDIAYLLTIPNIEIVAPTTEQELKDVMDFSRNIHLPLAIRFPKDYLFQYDYEKSFEYGKWNEVIKGNDTLIIACGAMFKEIIMIKNLLFEHITPTIVSAAWVRPLDSEYILNNFSKYEKIIVLEDGYIKSGFGTEILEFMSENNLYQKVIRIGLEHKYLQHAKREEIMQEENLSGDNLLQNILDKIK